MMSFRTIMAAAVAICVAGACEGAAKSGQGRVGIGMNLDAAEATYSLDSLSAIGAGISFDLTSGDFDSTDAGFDAWYQRFLKAPEPAGLFFLAGLGYGSSDAGGGSTDSGFHIFGGLGTEYFLPGTKSVSIEAKVGLMIQFLSQEYTSTTINPLTGTTVKTTVKASGTSLSIQSLSGALFILRYYIN